jgi:DNA replication protein DnaC
MPSSRNRKPPTCRDPDLLAGLLDIGLHGVAAVLDEILAQATKQRLGPVELLEQVVRIEKQDRARRGLERRRSRSRVGSFKPLSDFDWAWPRKIDRDMVERAVALAFLAEGANLILLGAHGLGKTMILKNVTHEAILAGHAALFVTAAQLLNNLSAQDHSRALERRIKYYCTMPLLAIDELGYLSYDSRAADLLFEVVSRRHAAGKSIAMSTNLAFSDWNVVFPNATSTVALIDRLTHRADIIQIEGDSWRRKEALERQNRNSEP